MVTHKGLAKFPARPLKSFYVGPVVDVPSSLLFIHVFKFKTVYDKYGNSRWTSEMSDTNAQLVSNTDIKISNMSNDSLLVDGKPFTSPGTSFQLS